MTTEIISSSKNADYESVSLKDIQSDQEKSDELFSFSIFKTTNNQDQSNTFIYFQLLLDCLLRMKIDLPDRIPLISFCRKLFKNNQIQLDIIDEFERTYSSDQALVWYQRDTCFSKILNKALALQNIEILFLFRFFLRDLQKQLQQNQYPSPIRLYRSEIITNDELESLKNSMGEFISIHSFFSMKFDRQLAMSDLVFSENVQGILFEIDLDPQLDNIKPFSMINSSEILIMSGSIFRLIDIHFIDKQFSIIRIELSNENFQSVFNSMKNKIGYDDQQINLITLGNLLWKMDRLDEAEKYYLNLIDLVSSDQANLYYHLGHIYSDKNDYDSSLKYYKKSLDIWMKSNDTNLANNYNAIATNYWKKGDYKQAYESFNKALEIFKQIYGEDHMTVAMCLNNMGTVISNEKNYTEALNYYLKALNLFQKYLSMNHPNLASLHCNISTIYKNLHQIDSALEHLNLSLNIYEQVLPLNHPNISIMLKNIAFLYEQKEDFQQALNCYEKISNIYRQTLSSTDPMVIQNEEKIQLLSSKQSGN